MVVHACCRRVLCLAEFGEHRIVASRGDWRMASLDTEVQELLEEWPLLHSERLQLPDGCHAKEHGKEAASHIRLSLSTAPHIRLSVSITHHVRWSLKLPNLFFSEDIKVPSQELATLWSIVAHLRNLGFSWHGGSYKANRNGSGDVEGLCSCAQALIPVLHMAPSGCKRTKRTRSLVRCAQLWVTASTASEWYNFAKRAVVEDFVGACTSCGEWEAAAKTVTVPTSPTEVQAMFVGFDDDQPQVHEASSSTESEVHITCMKCSCERCKMSSLSAAPSSSEFCGSKLLLASLRTSANLTLRLASKSCADTWKTAIASLEPPPISSASRGGQGQIQSQSQKKRRVIGTVLRKPAAQSQTTPEEPSLGELEGPFTLVRRGRNSEPQRRGKLPRWVAGQSESCSQQILENVTELRNCLEHERCHYEEGRRSIVAFAGAPGNLFLS